MPSSSTAGRRGADPPQPDVENAYKDKARLRARKQEQYRKLKSQPAVTKDGVEITLQINAGLLVDMPHLEETGAARHRPVPHRVAVHGRRSTCRRTSEQQALYSAVLDAAQRQARHLPHARYRRRQGPALYGARGGGEPGAWLARDPHRPRPAAACCAAQLRALLRGGARAATCRSCSR